MTDRCVICGAEIPEGRQVCPNCERNADVFTRCYRCDLHDACMAIADRSGIDRSEVRARSAGCEAFVPEAGTDRIVFTVPGQPFGKQRPRVAGRIAYTPRETKAHEQEVIGAYFAQTDRRKFVRPEIRIKAYYGVPVSASKKRKAAMLAGQIRPQVKPDLDNVAKLVMDALDEIAYEDDKDVVYLSVEKFYSDDPRLEVEIRDAEA